MFYNGSGFKKYFKPFLKDFAITPIFNSIKNPQSNYPVEHMHRMIYSLFVTKDPNKDIDRKVYDYIDPSGETLD